MGEIIYFEDYLTKKEKSEEEQFSEDVAKVQRDLKQLIEDLADPEFQRQYDEAYEEIINAFRRVDVALDDYLDAFYIVMSSDESVERDCTDHYNATIPPEEEE